MGSCEPSRFPCFSADDAARLVRGEISVDAFRSAITHLLTGCLPCWSAVRSARARPAPPWVTPEAAYDAPFERAFAAALAAQRQLAELDRLVEALLPGQRHLGEGRLEPAAQRRRVASERLYDSAPRRARYETHRRIAWEARFTDPDRMVEHAGIANTLAQFNLQPEEVGGERALADLRAQAQGELANAWRVRNEYPQAWGNLQNAFVTRLEGTGDPALFARLLAIQACCHADRREFSEAHAAIDRALGIYDRLELDRFAAKLMVQKATFLGQEGDSGASVAQLRQALLQIDAKLDPELDLAARFNLASYSVDCGDLRAARRHVWGLAARFAARGQLINSAKVHWLSGKIHRELGDLERAEREVATARAEFIKVGDKFLCGLTSLELALLVHRRGAPGEAAALAAESLHLFRALEIGRDALAALSFLETLLGDRRISPDRLAAAFADFEGKARAAWSARPRKRRQVWLDR